MQHATFYLGYIWAALAVALGTGLPIGVHLTFVLGFGVPVGAGFASLMQTHGHLQLVGWAGLFVMGISVHFLPRLAGVPLAAPQWLRRILGCMIAGLGVRALGQALVPYLTDQQLLPVVLWMLVASGVLEWSGILGYVLLLLRLVRGVHDTSQRPALLSVRPFFGMMVSGWVVYGSLNLLLLVHMALQRVVVVSPAWNRLAMQSFVGLVLLPVAFAFSLRLLPLYLRLPPIDWPVQRVAYAYLLAWLLQEVPNIPPLLRLAPYVTADVASLGTMLKGGVIVWFVWQLDVLTRRREPWTARRRLHPGPERRPTRLGLPDYGEFGPFDRLVSSAYGWLVCAAGCDIMTGAAALLGHPALLSPTAILHLYLLGFITLLILGMAVRMLPGFLHKRRVASPMLVHLSLWFGNAAVVGRVGLFLLPATLLRLIPGGLVGARTMLALSGLMGVVAVGSLALNLWKTAALE
jgi:uncharacterized protein involved in response to NO